MVIINDYFLMTVSHPYETTVNEHGIITLNDAWIHEEVIERFNYKKVYGRIEACPLNFTDTPVELVDPGYPNPKKHVPGERIEFMVNQGHKKYNQNFYNCGGFDAFDTITLSDISQKTDIRRFDKVYFDPRVTEPENMVGRHNGQNLYKVRVDEIVCVVREGEILMQGEWCLVEPDMESWEEITTKAGIIMKPNPEAKYLQGIIRHFQHRDDVKAGDKIVYAMNADWTMKIEGKEYYAIENQDLVAKIV